MKKEKKIKIIIKTERWLTEEEYEDYKRQNPLPVNWKEIEEVGFAIIRTWQRDDEEVKTKIEVIF